MGSAELLCDRDISCQPVAAFDWSPDKARRQGSGGSAAAYRLPPPMGTDMNAKRYTRASASPLQAGVFVAAAFDQTVRVGMVGRAASL